MVSLHQHEAAQRMVKPETTSNPASKASFSSTEDNVVCMVGLGRQPNSQCGTLCSTDAMIKQRHPAKMT